jgi:NADPH2:quinone reductase
MMNALPSIMKAIAVEHSGGTPRLFVHEIAVPEPGEGKVLIRTCAAGVNRADLLQAEGHYPPPRGAPETLGLEVSGLVVACGPGVTRVKEGDAICALLQGGGYAEYALAAEDCLLPVPAIISLRDAAALPEAFFTVWTNLFDSARLQPGESVLVHGGTSGIGSAAIALLNASGHRVFTTAGSAAKCAQCLAWGAARAIDYTREDFVAVIAEETGHKGVDVILDMVGGDYIARNLEALARRGRLVNIAYMKGGRAELDFQTVLRKNLTLMATTLRNRSGAEKARIRDALAAEVWPLLEAGRIRPAIDSVFPLAEAGAAHARMRESTHIGKILLEIAAS